ncbi:ABC transporter substrate-binding protein [Demequina sp. SYSU T00068]|uniref:ABC transporter substrate-binding protein n=1 Tax=Demequina lignilytica TaxID=3051663 RepID=UPI00263832DB|nr:ABC transporter substrate-binding protein [Demequina sp. SYSU T00068]MDN4490438.1 ABC transporter substrate-binding protein [Demequina sp. SYSU T00068]
MSRIHATMATAAVAVLALAGCAASGSDAGDSSATTDGGSGITELRLGVTTQPATLDPAGGAWGARSAFYQAAYDTLIRQTADGELEPMIASGWELSEDSLTLTLTIQDGITFTDGTDLTSEDVVASLQRFKDGTSENAGDLADVSEITAIDDYTVELTLSAPNPAILYMLSRTAGLVASADAIEEGVDLATETVGSGPYILDTAATVSGSSYVYTANPDYWAPELQNFETLVINVYDEQTAALNAIKGGDIDVARLTSNSNIPEIEASGWSVVGNELDVFGLQLYDRGGEMSEALGDVRVRQAINYAFDKEAMLEALESGYGTVTAQVFPSTSEAFDPALDEYYTYDPEKALELMAEAGYADGLELSMMSTALLPDALYTLIAQQLAEIGITAVYTDPGANLFADLLAPKFPAAYFGLERNTDWQLIQFALAPTATFNPFHYEDPQVNEYIETIQYGDAETQAATAAELNAYIVEQAWFAPFYTVQGSVAVSPDFTVDMLVSNYLPAVYDIAAA